MFKQEKVVVFNHCYILVHDLKRTYIYPSKRDKYIISKKAINEEWVSKIHPLYAMLFSLVSQPTKLSEFIKKVSFFFDISIEQAGTIVLPFLNRNEPFYSNFGGVVSQFPQNIIIDADEAVIEPQMYVPFDFWFEKIDLERERFFVSPRTVVFMPTTHCTTKCIYCYADKSPHAQIPFEKVQSIIRECKELKIKSFFLTGGDIFLYKYWRELFLCMQENSFEINLLSTKTPLSCCDISFLKKHKAKCQFSLDTINPTVLYQLVGVNEDYLKKVEETFIAFEAVGLNFSVATVLTRLNANPKLLMELYSFIKKFSTITSWTIRVAMKSLYSSNNFEDLKLSYEMIKAIDSKIQEIQKHADIKIIWSTKDIQAYFQGKNGSKTFVGSRCSANYSNIMILPDGKVTICEQLYWNPKYIIGDLTKQSIIEVWNSERALKLAFPKREEFRDSSPCKKCDIFDECYSYPNRCIVNILKGYGSENDDFPDPRCVKAPRFVSELRPL